MADPFEPKVLSVKFVPHVGSYGYLVLVTEIGDKVLPELWRRTDAEAYAASLGVEIADGSLIRETTRKRI